MAFRRALVAAAVCAVAFCWVGAAFAASSNVVVSEFRFRGPSGASDEFVELYNLSPAAVDISGWKVNGSNNAGTTSTRATIPAGTLLGPGCHFLLTNSTAYSGAVAGDATFATGFTDDGGVAAALAGEHARRRGRALGRLRVQGGHAPRVARHDERRQELRAQAGRLGRQRLRHR